MTGKSTAKLLNAVADRFDQMITDAHNHGRYNAQRDCLKAALAEMGAVIVKTEETTKS